MSRISTGERNNRNAGFTLLRFSGIPFLMREVAQRRFVTILAYHDLHPEVACKHFEKLRRLYNIIPLREFVEARMSQTLHGFPAKSLVITLDDGYKGNYLLLPLLARMGVPVTVFVCTGVVGTMRRFWFNFHDGYPKAEIERLKSLPDVERMRTLNERGFFEEKEYEPRETLSDSEILEMKSGIDFQSHTVTHPCLNRCKDDESWRQIVDSKTALESKYSSSVYALAYPNGDYTEREVSFAREAGYQCGLTVKPGYNSAHTDIFKLKRIGVTDTATLDELIVKASGVWDCFVKPILKRLNLTKRFKH